MHFLVTNDDGIDAPGIQALADLLAQWGSVTVVAPSGPWSGCSHQVTVDRAVQVHQRESNRFAVDGTPADCVRIGLHSLARDADWTIAGINDGGNLGVDIFHSGTVAAAREAALLGSPAVAISQYRAAGVPTDWMLAQQRAQFVLRDLIRQPITEPGLWNVNLPSTAISKDRLAGDSPDAGSQFGPTDPLPISPGVAVEQCPVDFSQLPVAYQQEGLSFRYCGSYHHRLRRQGGDVDVCFSGRISVSWIRLA